MEIDFKAKLKKNFQGKIFKKALFYGSSVIHILKFLKHSQAWGTGWEMTKAYV